VNTLDAQIVRVTSSGQTSLVEAGVDGVRFSAVVLETAASAPYLREGHAIALLFKETELLLTRDGAAGTSAGNAFRCRVVSVTRGAVLSSAALDFGGRALASVLTTAALDALGVGAGDEITAFVSPFELSILA
jgi:molybdopterin-binding protein